MKVEKQTQAVENPKQFLVTEHLQAIPINEQILETFEQVSVENVFEFAGSIELLPENPRLDAQFDMDDYVSIVQVMDYAAELRAICTEDDLDAIPETLRFTVIDELGFISAFIPVVGLRYIGFLLDTISGNDFAHSKIETASDAISIGNNATSNTPCRLFENETDKDSLLLFVPAFVHVSDIDKATPQEIKETAGEILTFLCDLHISAVRTVTVAGIPYQQTAYGISALWLAMCNRFANARGTTCKACGKPLFATDERGTKRTYCDGTCRKWANRNPEKPRKTRKHAFSSFF